MSYHLPRSLYQFVKHSIEERSVVGNTRDYHFQLVQHSHLVPPEQRTMVVTKKHPGLQVPRNPEIGSHDWNAPEPRMMVLFNTINL